MTFASATTAPTRPDRAAILLGAGVLLAMLVFSGALSELVTRWMRQEEYSHGFFIPLIAAFLLWRRREALLASVGRPSLAGPALIVLSGIMLVIGELSAIFILAQTGFIVCLAGLVLATGGVPLLRVAALPLFFLVFAIPLPYFINSILSWRLQLLSSDLGVWFIRLFGIPVYLEGNVIDLGTYKLQVAEACSGLRYLYPLLSLGFLAAYMFRAPLWQRIFVFLSAVPITIAMNSFRIGVIGMLVDRWGTGMAEGALHFFEGWVIFIACAAVLGLEMLLLSTARRRPRLVRCLRPARGESGPRRRRPGRRAFGPHRIGGAGGGAGLGGPVRLPACRSGSRTDAVRRLSHDDRRMERTGFRSRAADRTCARPRRLHPRRLPRRRGLGRQSLHRLLRLAAQRRVAPFAARLHPRRRLADHGFFAPRSFRACP